MLILLPPSETKKDGGSAGSRLQLSELRFPSLRPARLSAVAELRALARNAHTMMDALKLGAGQSPEVQRNKTIGSSPTMAAMDRYTGVLYDAFEARSLGSDARQFAARHVAIHSALFGLIGAADHIPAYRLSHDSRLPKHSLKRLWREPIANVLGEYPGLILDLRSQAYVGLGPTSGCGDARFVHLVAEGSDGERRALNHFNKKGKGAFVRSLVTASIDHPNVDSLVAWAAANGIDLRRRENGDLELAVHNSSN